MEESSVFGVGGGLVMDELHLRKGNKEAGPQMSQGHTWPPDLQVQSPPRSGQGWR